MAYPPSLDIITVTGAFIDGETGAPASGSVTFTSLYLLQGGTDDAFVSPVEKTVLLDAAGEFSVALPATDDPQWVPQGYTYRVAVSLDGGYTRVWRIPLPYTTVGGTVDLADITPAEPVPAVTTYVLASRVGQVGGPAGPLDANGKVPLAQLPVAGGGSGVDSVNGQTGTVVLTAANVSAEPTVAAGTTGQFYRGDKSWQTLNKAAVGLASVDNTADTAKPVSTAQQTALNGKAPVGKLHNGSAYVDSTSVVLYVGPTDPGAVPNGSVWIDTSG